MPGARLAIAAFLLVAMQSMPQPACSPAPQPAPPPPGPPGGPQIPTETFTAQDGTRFGVQVFLTGLQIPWSLAFAPDGRLFLTERPGRVRIVQNGQLVEQPALALDDVWHQGEAGLLGLALHPSFGVNSLVYLFYTAAVGGSPVNRIVRYREVDGTLGERAVLVDGLPAGVIHDGGRLRFGPDGHLYLALGDVAVPSLAQSLTSLAGKILRFTEDGRTPPDNPFNSPIWSLGHRNPQGLDWHPVTADLWVTEHGQVGNDELNRIVAGGNYGWPVVEGTQTRPDTVAPVLVFSPAIAPSGLSFYTGTAIAGFSNDIFFTALAGMHLHRVRLDPAERRRVLGHEALLQGRYGRLRDVVSGPDGALYVSTSNRDGRTTPVAGDDRVLRIVAAP